MFKWLWPALVMICIMLHPNAVQAQDLQEFSKSLSSDQISALEKNQQDHLTVDRLLAKRVLTQEQVTEAHKAIDREVEAAVGRKLSQAEIGLVVAEANKSVFAGIFTFVNIIRVIAAILLVIALCWLCRHYLENLPVEAYEIAGWAAVVVALISGKVWPVTGMWLVLPGAIGLIGTLSLTLMYHGRNSDMEKSGLWQIISAVCAVVWGICTVVYASPVLGFMTVMAVEAFLGFSALVLPFCVCIGFRDKEVIPRTMAASFIIMGTFGLLTVFGIPAGILTNFRTGGLFMGAFVYYLGCLIVSSKFYCRDGQYLGLQLLTIISGVAAFYFGSAFNMPTVLGIGGTFFVLYLLEKYYEIPWKNVGWAWSLLGLAVGMYGFAMFAWNHPQYFLFGVH